MTKSIFFIRLISILSVFGLLAGYAAPALADESTRFITRITFFQPRDAELGKPFTLSGTIKDNYGHPVPDKSVIFSIDDAYLGQARSDENGNFERKISHKLNAGKYVIKAAYKGSPDYTADTAFMDLNVLPAEVKIQTVPAISGITFKMDGREFVSGKDGLASIKINKVGSYHLEVLTNKYNDPSQRVEFGRWAEELSFDPFREVDIPVNGVIQVGFNVYHQISQTFQDLDGNPVGPRRIKEFTIRSAQGDVFTFPDGLPRWIPASRIAHRVNGLEATNLLYSVVSVKVDGSNVVNQSQQRFYTHSNETWPISLLLYSLRISAQDGMFGSAVGKSVNVEFPNGQTTNYPLNSTGTVDIHSLARGMYYIDLVGAHGLDSRIPVALSRNQTVQTKIITYLDLTVFALLGALVAVGLLLYGRPWILHAALRLSNRAVWENLGAKIFKPAFNRAEIFIDGSMSNKPIALLPDESQPIAVEMPESVDTPIDAVVFDIPEAKMEPVERNVMDNNLPAKKKSQAQENKNFNQ